MSKYTFIVIIILFLGCNLQDNETSNIQVEILVVGGSTSGTTAGIQAARMGRKVLIVESSEWLGGMLTAAGVSAIDGNHKLPSGLWGEFRNHLYNYYGGSDSVSTGWVSNTLFEPDVGEQIIRDMVTAESNITILHGYYIDTVAKEDSRISEVSFTNLNGSKITVTPQIVIEATEYGDVIARAGEKYSIGMEPKSETNEPTAPQKRLPWPQDLTYVATLEEKSSGQKSTIKAPRSYNPEMFQCVCAEVCDKARSDLLRCQKVLNYGRLPNNKFMINWPNRGNDTYLEILEKSHSERIKLFEKAKNKTLSWIYFMQTEAGFSNLVLDEDVYPTDDHLALKPYIRESRRIYGQIRLTLPDIRRPYKNEERPVYKSAVAVGDYPVDHHRKLNPEPLVLDFPEIPSYSVPYNVMLPQNTTNLIVAEKSISVTSLVNGTTRLQPVVMQIGQAAGAAAAIALDTQQRPDQINIRELQHNLLSAGLWLMPYMDTTPDQPAFQVIQKVALAGWMRGEGIPVDWANETRFYPDSTLTIKQLKTVADRMGKSFSSTNSDPYAALNHKSFLNILYQMQHNKTAPANAVSFYKQLLPSFKWFKANSNNTLVTRKDAAIWLNAIFKPFEKPLFVNFVGSENSSKH